MNINVNWFTYCNEWYAFSCNTETFKYGTIADGLEEVFLPLQGLEDDKYHHKFIFVLDSSSIVSERKNYNLLLLLSDIGGLYGIIFPAGYFIVSLFISPFTQALLAKSMFKQSTMEGVNCAEKKEEWLNSIERMKFSFCSKIKIAICCNICLSKRDRKAKANIDMSMARLDRLLDV